MNPTLLRKLLRDLRIPLLLTALLVAGYELLWFKVTERLIEQFKLLREMVPLQTLAMLETKLFAGPGQIIRALLGGELINLSDPLSVLSIGYVHPFIQIVLCTWAIGRAAGALAGELNRGTLELLLAQPIPRRQVVFTHIALDALFIPGLCLCLFFGTWLGGKIIALPGDPIDMTRFTGPLLNAAALMFAVSGYTLALSACGRFRWRVVSWSLGATLVQFLLNLLGQLWDVLTPLRPLTVFYYYQPQPIMLNGRWTVPIGLGLPGLDKGAYLFELNVVVVPFLVGVIGYAVAVAIFTRRDLPAPL